MAGLAIVAILPLAADVPFLFRDRVCQSGELECRWILVQADQVANDPRGRTTVLNYALHRRERPSGDARHRHRRAGVSGVATADGTLARFDRRLTDDFDIVLFDTRASATPAMSTVPVERPLPIVAVVRRETRGHRRLRRRCIEETGVDPALSATTAAPSWPRTSRRSA